MIPWPLISALIVLAAVVKQMYSSSLRDIPGPFLAPISSFWKAQQIIKGHMEEGMLALHRKHDIPLKLTFGDFVRIADNEVSIGRPDAVKHLLHANIASWYEVFSIPDYRFLSQMSETDPQRHIDKGNNSESFVDDIIESPKSQLDQLAGPGKPVHLDKWFNYFAFDVVGEVAFSQSFGLVKTGVDIGNAIANARKLALYVPIMGRFVWFHNMTISNPLMSTLGLIPASHLFDTCVAAIENRKKNPEPRNDMIERWLHVRSSHPERMADEEVYAAAAANVGAGAACRVADVLLLRRSVFLRRLQKEIDGAQARGELSRVVQYSEVRNLPYLQAYTLLSINLWVIHRNPELFGADSDSFNPERWLDKEAKMMDYFLVHVSETWTHFEINKLVETLVRDYEFERLDPKECDWPCRARRREVAV
ncbi:cytochrome P450 [Aspergillus recurvatus]